MRKGLSIFFVFIGLLNGLHSFAKKKIVVDINGKGDFRSIQEAINSLPDSSAKPRTIYILPGVYREKLFVSKHNIIFEGKDRDKTIITQDIARDEWRCDHPDDWGVATMNLNGNDITLKNLTIANDYGFNYKEPRVVACAENCTFYANTGPASIWHDGTGNADFKTVLKNCRFDGFSGFNLGRYHRDAQFFLVGCQFSKNMADKDIYLVPTDNTILWGRRIYYADCHKEGGDYTWFFNNLATAPGSPKAGDITVDWLFKGKWNPQSKSKKNGQLAVAN